MDYIRLGKSNMNVSRICLGCNSFGDAEMMGKPWLLNQEQTNEIVKKALDLGINFFDTSNNYNKGQSEIYLGNALKKYTQRDKVIIATKVYWNEGGLSKEAIFREIEGSLKRLQTDYIDLYIIHRWDYCYSIEETMEALNDLIKLGKIKYIGCSSMYSFQLLKAQECARKHGWATFISMQNYYNLINREEEREMMQLLEEEGMVCTPYSPLASGKISRPIEVETIRSQNDIYLKEKFKEAEDIDLPIIKRIQELADKKKVSMAQISLAWILSKPMVACPIIGGLKIKYIEDAVNSLKLKLTEEEIKYLEELYKPHFPYGPLSKEEDVHLNMMEYIKLGKSDLKVSRICFGAMTFGDAKLCNSPWLLNQEETDKIVKRALDLGINFFDTANVYSKGTSEIYLGNALKKYTQRDKVIIATKVFWNEGGLSKDAIKREIEGSLKRLQTDYVDLYIIHRWDYSTPIEETMETLNDLVKNGKVKYLGCSAMFSYQFFKAQECARKHGWATFISMQNHYNLIYREEEKEMMQLLEEENVVMTPYSPLASGRLARDWDNGSERYKGDLNARNKYECNKDYDILTVKRIKELADKHKVTMAQISLAWVLSKKLVASPVFGATKISQLEEACKAVHLKLNDEEIKYLEELYRPHKVIGALTKAQDPRKQKK